jgi:hypothetical protein
MLMHLLQDMAEEMEDDLSWLDKQQYVQENAFRQLQQQQQQQQAEGGLARSNPSSNPSSSSSSSSSSCRAPSVLQPGGSREAAADVDERRWPIPPAGLSRRAWSSCRPFMVQVRQSG